MFRLRLKINDQPLLSTSQLESFIYENDIKEISNENILELNKIFKFNINKTELEYIDLFSFIKEHKIKISVICRYIKEFDYIFDLEKFKNYILFLKNNKNANSTLEFYIVKYGEEIGNLKYLKFKNNLKSKPSPYTIKYWIDKGFDEIEANKKIYEFKKNKSTSKESFIKRHGEKKGLELFYKFQETSKHTEEKYIEKYGEIEGILKWDEYCNKKGENSVFKASYWINKGYSEEESEIMRKEFHKMNLNTSSVDYWISKGLSEEDSISRVREIYNKKRVAFGKASDESVHFLRSLLRYLKFENIEYRLGVKGNSEFSIYCKEEKRLYFYDLTIPSINLIIEYNGYKYHPNPNKLSKEEWKNWKSYNFQKNVLNEIVIDADTAYKNDLYKKHVAESKGFEVFTVWSTDNRIDINNKIINLINKKLDENKKNN